MVFEGIGLIGNSLVLLASIIVVVIASEVTINNSVKVSNMTGFGKTTVGFILVGFATSLPELSVVIFGAALLVSPLTVHIGAFSNLAIFSLIANLFLGTS
jgi:Ca2+/Na+ antiporter